MSDNAFARIASRLRGLCEADRDWLLGQLTPDDGRRLVEALRAHRQEASARKTPKRNVAPEGQAPNEGDTPWSRLARAGAMEMREVLADEPDWAIAMLVAQPWPWSQALLSDFAPERIRALRALAAELEGVKPRVREAILSEITAKLERAVRKPSATETFDAALERAVEEVPMIPRRRAVRA